MDIKELLTLSTARRASDLHLSVGLPPRIRVDGNLCILDKPPLSQEDLINFLSTVMDEPQLKAFKAGQEIDFAFDIQDLSRFRVNAYVQARGISLAIRLIPKEIMSVQALMLPPTVTDLLTCEQGLILVTGPTGCGKSTTLAAMVDHFNTHHALHIITIEDPIEFVHESKQSLINQRELHHHTKRFDLALRSALRADPDIIVLGELRDLETIRLALTAAETGHLVLASVHTNSAANTISRLIEVFPGSEQAMIRSLLTQSLEAVVAQRLVNRLGGGRVALCEVLRASPAVKHLIREDKIAQLESCIQTGQAKGMQSMSQHWDQLVNEGIVHQSSKLTKI